jgi:hypothetical protein
MVSTNIFSKVMLRPHKKISYSKEKYLGKYRIGPFYETTHKIDIARAQFYC